MSKQGLSNSLVGRWVAPTPHLVERQLSSALDGVEWGPLAEITAAWTVEDSVRILVRDKKGRTKELWAVNVRVFNEEPSAALYLSELKRLHGARVDLLNRMGPMPMPERETHFTELRKLEASITAL